MRAQVRTLRPPVIAYGISAGGTIAAALAASGDVAAGVNVVGPTDLVNWPTGMPIMAGLRMSRQERRAASPILRLSNVRPQLQQAGLGDPRDSAADAAGHGGDAGEPPSRFPAARAVKGSPG